MKELLRKKKYGLKVYMNKKEIVGNTRPLYNKGCKYALPPDEKNYVMFFLYINLLINLLLSWKNRTFHYR